MSTADTVTPENKKRKQAHFEDRGWREGRDGRGSRDGRDVRDEDEDGYFSQSRRKHNFDFDRDDDSSHHSRDDECSSDSGTDDETGFRARGTSTV